MGSGMTIDFPGPISEIPSGAISMAGKTAAGMPSGMDVVDEATRGEDVEASVPTHKYLSRFLPSGFPKPSRGQGLCLVQSGK